jgi:hypothetical protein
MEVALGERLPLGPPLGSNRVITEALSPAAAPKNPSSAGTKSMLDSPCRYSSGSTAATLGLRRHQRGKITLWNCTRCPVAGSTRRSSTRGRTTLTWPAAVVSVRAGACPLRTTSRWPRSSTSSAWAAR